MIFEITQMDEVIRVELIEITLKRTKERMLGNTYNTGNRVKKKTWASKRDRDKWPKQQENSEDGGIM